MSPKDNIQRNFLKRGAKWGFNFVEKFRRQAIDCRGRCEQQRNTPCISFLNIAKQASAILTN